MTLLDNYKLFTDFAPTTEISTQNTTAWRFSPDEYFGTGKDGTLVVNELDTVRINKFAQVLKVTKKGSKKLKVNRVNIFTAGKEVYIIQMKGSNAGESMFARVTTVDFNRSFIIISAGLTFDCSSTESNRCQVVTVPHFVSVTLKDQATISGASWNGETGGIIVFRSKNMADVGSRSSQISACGIGFRGGTYGENGNKYGFQGESYTGSASRSHAANRGGGGGGSRYSSGGGGGAHSSSGSDGSYGNGGVAYATSSLTEKIFMGSGGGGGGKDSTCCALPGAGGNGGGIVMIFTPVIIGSGGTISSCGGKGQDAGHNFAEGGDQGGGGGGAGGSVLLITDSEIPKNGSVSIDVTGGAAGTKSNVEYRANAGGKGGYGVYKWLQNTRGPMTLY
ncbi:PE-PGRS family protein PE_PGRS4-like [Corticium candelabrum]|uniref:PE-PGRS family protein PE_PGRS4-like n=1 Tax=Corticium candelabrum TaxID=121492 RepID=UPI002E27501D|nr:PE-PGRS family protein PE_PGRS4-like [Corticium candelabrum]